MGNANFKKLFKNIKKLNYKGLLILQTARAPIKNKDINEIQTNISFIRDYL
jgi:L-ribulose-5-phosphate 3-epimerase UlaE